MNKNLFLVGPMGAGKTTIGRQLAKTLHRDFYDSDREIESRTGATIALIFELEQESGFRQRERDIINELTQLQNIVLATGGGAILDKTNRQNLRQRGHVIYLSASVEQLYERTCHDKSRPLLQTADPKQKLEDLLAIRDPLYRETAHTVIETNNNAIRQIVNEICQLLNLKASD